jgi:hypothetical protein
MGSMSGQQIYEMFHTGPGSDSLQGTAEAARKLAERYHDHVGDVHNAQKAIRSGWEGQAADAAHASANPLGEHFDTSSPEARTGSQASTDQAQAFHTAKGKVRPVPDKPSAGDYIAGYFEDLGNEFRLKTSHHLQNAYEQAQAHAAASQGNVDAYNEYAAATGRNTSAVPTDHQYMPQDLSTVKVAREGMGSGPGVGAAPGVGTGGGYTPSYGGARGAPGSVSAAPSQLGGTSAAGFAPPPGAPGGGTAPAGAAPPPGVGSAAAGGSAAPAYGRAPVSGSAFAPFGATSTAAASGETAGGWTDAYPGTGATGEPGGTPAARRPASEIPFGDPINGGEGAIFWRDGPNGERIYEEAFAETPLAGGAERGGRYAASGEGRYADRGGRYPGRGGGYRGEGGYPGEGAGRGGYAASGGGYDGTGAAPGHENLGRGARAGVGEYGAGAAEEPFARPGASGAAERPGMAGMPMGAGAGGGDRDREHKTPDYLRGRYLDEDPPELDRNGNIILPAGGSIDEWVRQHRDR